MLGVTEQRMYHLDDVLKPEVRARGSKMITRSYDYAIISQISVEDLTRKSSARGPRAVIVTPLPADAVKPAKILLPGLMRELRLRKNRKNAFVERARNYGLSEEQVEKMFVDQGNKCGCCGGADPKHSNWNIDHDHATGMARGILCSPCNRMIGSTFDPATGERDNLTALEASYKMARAYLSRVAPIAADNHRLRKHGGAGARVGLWDRVGRPTCLCGCGGQPSFVGGRGSTRARYMPGHFRANRENGRMLARKNSYRAVRTALGAIILAILCAPAPEGPPRRVMKKVRDTTAMAEKISATLRGKGWTEVHGETILRMLAEGHTYREITEATGVSAGSVRGKYGGKYKRIPNFVT